MIGITMLLLNLSPIIIDILSKLRLQLVWIMFVCLSCLVILFFILLSVLHCIALYIFIFNVL